MADPGPASSALCPMCREPLKPGANACVWCGFLLQEAMQREEACRSRKALLGTVRPSATQFSYGDRLAWLALTLLVPTGLVVGQGGVITVLSSLLLLGLVGVGFILLIRGAFMRALGYGVAFGVGVGVFLIILLAWGVAFH